MTSTVDLARTVSPSESAPAPVKRFRLGFMSHVISADGAVQAYRDLAELFVAAEELGVDAGFIAVHHLAGGERGSHAPAGQLPSPLVFLASLLDRTSRIGLGTAAVVLPLEDPVRLAEDVSVLDTLSGGRVLLGLGTGGANLHRYGAFGLDPAGASDRYFEHLETFLAAIAGEPVRDTEFRLTPPAPTLADRVWGTHGSEASARRAARFGTGLMFGTSDLDALTVQRPIAEAYLDEWGQRGASLAPAAIRDGLRPRLGAIRMIYPAADVDTATRELDEGLRAQAARVAARLDVAASDLTLEQIVAGLNMHIGAPDDIVSTMEQDPALLEYVELVVPVISTFVAGTSRGRDIDRAIRGLEVLATEVAPRLGWHPAS